jgi:hypothetical protein
MRLIGVYSNRLSSAVTGLLTNGNLSFVYVIRLLNLTRKKLHNPVVLLYQYGGNKPYSIRTPVTETNPIYHLWLDPAETPAQATVYLFHPRHQSHLSELRKAARARAAQQAISLPALRL